ncbi:hypothetical protein GCM10027578_44610 [Spirosoma luteolum]
MRRNTAPACRTRWACTASAWIILLGLLLGLVNMVSAQKPARRKPASIRQGICGKVVEKRGNQMPGPDRSVSAGQPVEREVLIFPLLNLSQVEAGSGGFINSVGQAKPVLTVRSGKDGSFCAKLPVGRYSVLVREPNGLYANLSDTQNNINPIRVERNRRSTLTVEITHQAVY